ncbi:MAG: PCRF domain-containing protein, partial [Deltaproteobacteria bacterium]|nr:PCRF domain-containing protein [Deltaproteobacteria bacterium]
MFDKFADLEDKISQLEGRLSDPELVTNQKEFRKVVKEHAHLTKLNTIYSSFRQVQQEIEESKALLHDEDEDPEFKELARAEIEELETKEKKLDEEIKLILLPPDPNDEKNTFLEIRAGTGGDEAALFVGDLFRMYSRFAES